MRARKHRRARVGIDRVRRSRELLADRRDGVCETRPDIDRLTRENRSVAGVREVLDALDGVDDAVGLSFDRFERVRVLSLPDSD
ncbi:MAG: hypothetical protein V5A55_09745 [Halovenus sp.]